MAVFVDFFSYLCRCCIGVITQQFVLVLQVERGYGGVSPVGVLGDGKVPGGPSREVLKFRRKIERGCLVDC